MLETFVPLREWLAPVVPAPMFTPEPELPEESELASIPVEEDEYHDVMREVRFFRAALRESLEERTQMLVREIAIEVVARELELAPADIAGIVESACARYAPPLSIRVHPDEASELRGLENVVADTSIRRGDVMLSIASGTIDASLGMRLVRALSAVGI
jgi:flagellar biosynthesis/type III secretory pathway protein FliH